MPSLTEAQLDKELGDALRNRADFARWFLQQTKFAGEAASCVLCRDDNPWRAVVSERHNSESSSMEMFKKDRETDVLAIYQTTDGRRLALHVENKLANGIFTPHQPESYRDRLRQWQMQEKLGMYDEATSVLIAPRAFYERNLVGAKFFEAYISHEAIGHFLATFKPRGASAA